MNAEIIDLVRKGESWEQAKTIIAQNYGSNSLYQFRSSAYIVSLFYCLLVVPHEIWKRNNGRHLGFEDIFDDADKRKIHALLELEDPIDNFSVSNFLQNLRNSIAHADYDIDTNMTFTFYNLNQNGNKKFNQNGNKKFECVIKAKSIPDLLLILGPKLSNAIQEETGSNLA